MNMKALLGAVLALVLAVGGAAFLVASFAKPAPPPPLPVPEALKDQLGANPFDLAGPGPKPKVVVNEPFHQFAAMILGTEKSHDFVFKNEGEGPLRLAKGRLMCKCTIPVVPDQEIKPGESINIKLTWKPEDSNREFSKEAVIWTNDPANPKITLAIKGEVYDDPMSYPSQFSLGDIAFNKDHESEVGVLSSTSTEMKVDSVEVSHPEWMSVTWAPADVEKFIEEGLKSPKPLSGFTVKLKITPNDSVGPFNGWVKLKSNLKDEVKTIDVIGVRTGPISIHGQDYQAANSMVDLKRFKSTEGKVVKLFMYLEPFDQDLQITEANSESKGLTATLHKETKSAGSKKDFYILSLQANKSLSPGTVYTFEKPDQLTLKTNHPNMPEIRFSVRYVVN
jgi:hypothetical protein